MDASKIIEPSRITDPSEVLTSEVIENIEAILRNVELSVTEIFYKLGPDQGWKVFSTQAAQNQESVPSFCAHMQRHQQLGKLCSNDREEMRAQMTKATSDRSRAPFRWTCPYGLTLFGVSFRVGEAQFAFRTSPWMEKGNEGQVIAKTIRHLTASGLNDQRNTLLESLREQLSHSETQFRVDAGRLQGLINIISYQAATAFERRIAKSREDFLQELRELVVPLMSELNAEKRSYHMREPLERIIRFFGLEGCACYSSSPGTAKSLNRVAVVPSSVQAFRSLPLSSIPTADLLAEGDRLFVQSCSFLPPSAQPPSAWTVVVRYPLQTYGLFAIWPYRADKQLLLDENVFYELARLVTLPICVAHLGNEIGLEAERRLRQSRNAAHTVRLAFQGILGDLGWLRAEIDHEFHRHPPAPMLEPLRRLEDGIQHVDLLLRGHEVLEDAALKTYRGKAFVKKKQPILPIIRGVRERLVYRARELWIDILVEDSVDTIPDIPLDETAISLALFLLLDNAIKYSHRGIAGKNRQINIEAIDDASQVSIDITDFGLGIHPTEMQKIFEPYTQGTVIDKTRPISGQGIGLSAAQEIAARHGGHIKVQECVAFPEHSKIPIPAIQIESTEPGSREASALLQHCKTVFRLSLPKK